MIQSTNTNCRSCGIKIEINGNGSHWRPCPNCGARFRPYRKRRIIYKIAWRPKKIRKQYALPLPKAEAQPLAFL